MNNHPFYKFKIKLLWNIIKDKEEEVMEEEDMADSNYILSKKLR